ncbi:MAG: hypothetical protein M0006_07800 [Magnetospirillum sp.]|nr:hypothetical protein [Magnetospirillum sp.]
MRKALADFLSSAGTGGHPLARRIALVLILKAVILAAVWLALFSDARPVTPESMAAALSPPGMAR